MNNSLYPQKYECSCGTEQDHYVWSKELNKKKFPCTNPACSKKVGVAQIVVPEPPQYFTGIRTDTKNRV